MCVTVNAFVRLLTVAVAQNLLIDVVCKWVSTMQTAAQCMWVHREVRPHECCSKLWKHDLNTLCMYLYV